ncbi:benzene 1,2-dioxygenase system ferredoxin--NAD(+) reductase subunit [Herbaspirillum frisingense GSF30]|uniref:Benzene 1,2-dioxygenase system ferredoxin--NAD(+) reductase subunit n=1 Tax=Herbaspirillum frisingense GSF30 TaxID=864073 RepID=A0AAI9IHS8_9BURK|nr:FAD-dependent oxidoreductase [Herbaspirillum frisingense]EOA06310.1 benzene 1,2-dioxygenase system ferredoxin--NAD(+) reductase subunit [Herbaspirillum frisingense GSF30]
MNHHQPQAQGAPQDQRVLIVGAGHAGGRVAQALRSDGFGGRILLLGAEPHTPYERPALSKELLLGSKTVDELMLGPRSFWEDPAMVEHRQGVVARIDDLRQAHLESGEVIPFDILVVASGGQARGLTIPGADLPEVRVLRTIEDCLALRPAMAQQRRLLVIGGGVIGMEAASSAAALGMEVTVVEGGARVMARCLPPEGSQWLQALHEQRGIKVLTGVSVSGIAKTAEGLRIDAQCAGQEMALEADLVLVAVGISLNTDFLEGSPVRLDNGVLTDAWCRNPDAPWCYAVGDVANSFSPLYGRALRQETWRNAENQARAVSAAIVGRPEPYIEVPWMWTDQLDRNIQVVGIYTPGDLVISRIPPGERAGVLLWLHEGRVAGGMLVDSGRERRQLEELVRRGSTIDAAVLRDPAISLKELVRS